MVPVMTEATKTTGEVLVMSMATVSVVLEMTKSREMKACFHVIMAAAPLLAIDSAQNV